MKTSKESGPRPARHREALARRAGIQSWGPNIKIPYAHNYSTLSSSFRATLTKLMKEIRYGKDYRYAHDYPEALVDQGYFPSELRERIYYRPSNRGYERVIKERLDKWRKILAQRRAFNVFFTGVRVLCPRILVQPNVIQTEYSVYLSSIPDYALQMPKKVFCFEKNERVIYHQESQINSPFR